ncbi:MULTISPECIES: hypothetical protein [unclassified Frondihabitans]|uniref:hypothetical protein n=1 Tax=unclassified Frondihabitans TaxID=2626248 RepID=UPI000F51286B|nr:MULTISPECIES: hypothetical protein [unclassified Frondihabitans]RPE74574.1 hypothetical protein EDF37_3319 [Frondihabitans sp. PhB153]RPF03003.1 hypothetical protein EDF39_3387 [Frondihabitans sp. PhB161]
MIDWFTWVQAGIATAVALFCIVMGLSKRQPNDYTVGAMALIEVLLLVQLVVAIVAPFVGNQATGSVVEFYIYLVVALLLPPLAVVWALVDRSRWSNVVMGAGAFAVAVMIVRMLQIWTA